MFVMISGYFLLDIQKNIVSSAGSFYNRRINRILIPYLFWSAVGLSLWFVYDLFIKKVELAVFFNEMQIFVLKGACFYHLWYLGMLLGLYLATPFINAMLNDCSIKKLTCVICYLFAGVYLTLYLSAISKTNYQYSFLLLFVNYLPYFLLGKPLGNYFLHCGRRKRLFALCLVLSIVSTVLIILWNSYFTNNTVSFLHPLCTFQCTALYGTILLFPWKIGADSGKFVILLSSYTFGIYLIHGFIALFLKRIEFISSQNAQEQIPIIFSTTLIISLLLTIIIKRIPCLNKVV